MGVAGSIITRKHKHIIFHSQKIQYLWVTPTQSFLARVCSWAEIKAQSAKCFSEAWRSKFSLHKSTLKKSNLVALASDPKAGEAETHGSLGLAGQVALVSSRPMREPVSKAKVNGMGGTIADYPRASTFMHPCVDSHLHRQVLAYNCVHTQKFIVFKSLKDADERDGVSQSWCGYGKGGHRMYARDSN